MLNNVCLVGRLTASPELKYTPSGVPMSRFTLAVNRSYVKAGEERQTDFIDIVVWRRTAEFTCRYFKKGQMIAVEGSIQTRAYDAKDGTKRKAFEVVANNVHFTDSRKSPVEDSEYAEEVSGVSQQEKNIGENASVSASDGLNLSDIPDTSDEHKDSFVDDELLSEDDLPF